MSKNLRILCFVSLFLGACATRDAETQPSFASASTSPQALTQPSPTPDSPIRLIGFGNFTYPGKPVYEDVERFTLQRGKFTGSENHDRVGLVYLDYGDATGDGTEEAIAILNMSVRGSAIPYYVYIYTLEDGKPKLLWAFATGDRADGGLRQVRADRGELVIELYGKGKTIGKDLYAEDGMAGGDCCPTHFTRAKYEWRQKMFHQKVAEEVLANPSGGAPVVMSDYRVSGEQR